MRMSILHVTLHINMHNSDPFYFWMILNLYDFITNKCSNKYINISYKFILELSITYRVRFKVWSKVQLQLAQSLFLLS